MSEDAVAYELPPPTAHHQNGGRPVPELPLYTFKDTGRTVRIRKVSPLLANEIRKAFKPPRPPVQEVDYGGEKRLEENPADPDYQAALNAYNEELGQKVMRMAIIRGVECEVDQAAVDQLRADMREIGVEIEADDKFVYIYYICCGTQDDLQELQREIMSRSQPTEEAIQAAVDAFRRDVPGAGPVLDQAAAVGLALRPVAGVEPRGAVVGAGA